MVCVELCAPPCAECAELEEENKANKLSIAELSESKVCVGGGRCTYMGRCCVFTGGCGCCAA